MITPLRQTVHDYPHSDVAWLMLGQALLGQDDWEGAERALRITEEKIGVAREY